MLLHTVPRHQTALYIMEHKVLIIGSFLFSVAVLKSFCLKECFSIPSHPSVTLRAVKKLLSSMLQSLLFFAVDKQCFRPWSTSVTIAGHITEIYIFCLIDKLPWMFARSPKESAPVQEYLVAGVRIC